MADVQSALLYIFLFTALYVQVFFLLVAFKKRKLVIVPTVTSEDVEWPGVTVIVPCWNEEATVAKTVDSLFALDYPKDKLFIKIVDDGSTDATWEKMQQFKDHPMIELIRKENGGKHTAMNKALEMTTTDFVGCLDADAFAMPDALKKIMWTFMKDPDAMAVCPSVLVHEPKGIWQKAQQVEYDMGVFTKKVLGLIEAIHVTPGPFSIYRKKVFNDLGSYRKAHNAEDMEIAYRMQVNGYKIVHCHDAYVYTVTPDSLKKLYKQRLRWMYGFINNTIDYKQYLMRPKYGSFSIFTVPSGAFALFGAVIMALFAIAGFGEALYNLIVRLIATNFFFTPLNLSHVNFFYFTLGPTTIIMIILYIMFVAVVLIGQKMSQKKPVPHFSMIYFIVIYSFISPVWLLKATFNTITARETAWR